MSIEIIDCLVSFEGCNDREGAIMVVGDVLLDGCLFESWPFLSVSFFRKESGRIVVLEALDASIRPASLPKDFWRKLAVGVARLPYVGSAAATEAVAHYLSLLLAKAD